MVKKMILVGLLLAVIVFCPFKATAEEADGLTGSFTVGGAMVDIDHESAKAGEYSGIDDDRLYITGDADVTYRRGLFEIYLRGTDLGEQKKRIDLEIERYGIYEAFLTYDEIPHLISSNAVTPFDGAGNINLTLPAGFITGNSTAAMTNLNNNLKDAELRLYRKAGSADIRLHLGRDLNLRVTAKREEKKGTKSLGGTIGYSGAVILPEPVDYITDELGATLSYNRATVQGEIGYHLSSFNNSDESVSWDNPFSGGPAVNRHSLPPDNSYRKVLFSGGINLTDYSRFSVLAEYGEMRQDEMLLPYTNSAVTAPVALPRDSAEAGINTTHVMLNLSARPLSRLGIDAQYKYYKTENETPSDLFQYVRYDSDGTAQAGQDDINAVYNLPYDYIQNHFKADATYYLFMGTTIKAGYDYNIVSRDFREAATTTEGTYRAKISLRPASFASASADYSFAKREIDGDYDDSRIYYYYHTRDYISTVPSDERFSNHPDLRKFDIAERERNKYGVKAALSVFNKASIGLNYNRIKDEYTASVLGLINSDNSSYVFDLSFSPAESMTIYSFYAKEGLSYDIAGRELAAGGSSVTDPYDWRVNNDNDINTAGIGTTIDLLERRLAISADYSYSESNGSIRFVSGSSVPVPADMPDIKTYLHRLKASGKYKVTENLTAGVGYEVEKYSSEDWSMDGIGPASAAVPYLLALNGSTGDYEAHKGIVYVSYSF